MIDQQRMRVLVADHDPWTRLRVSDMFNQVGFTVKQASNGMAALRSAVADPPQLVVIGRGLPEISPADVVRTLRNDPRLRHTAVVQVRDGATSGLAADIRLDIDGRLELPCSSRDLLTAVLLALKARAPAQSEGRIHERPQTGTRLRVSPQRSHLRVLPVRAFRSACVLPSAAN